MNTKETAMRALANKRLFGVVFAGVRDPKTAFDRFWETGVTPEPVNPVRVATALRDEAVFQAAYGHLTGWRSLRQRLLTTGDIPTVEPQAVRLPETLVAAPAPVKAAAVMAAPVPTPARLAGLWARWGVKTHQVVAVLGQMGVWAEADTPLKPGQVEAVRNRLLSAYLARNGAGDKAQTA